LGNVIDPVDLIDKYGTDAVRFSLASLAYTGKDIPFGEDSIVGARNFCNKIYNATRFVLMNLPETKKPLKMPAELTDMFDKWIFHQYKNNVVLSVEHFLNKFQFAEASIMLYHFLWNGFCDWYLEIAKPRLQTDEKEKVLAILVNILYGTLKALHPIMPFITEELAESLKPYVDEKTDKFLVNEKYPKPYKETDKHVEIKMEEIQRVVTVVRTIRSHFHITDNEKISVIISGTKGNHLNALKENIKYLKLLAKADNVEIGENLPKPKHSATAVVSGSTIYVPLEGKIDFEKEKERLNKEYQKLSKEKEHYGVQLKNGNFIKNAPADKVEKVKLYLNEIETKLTELKSALKDLE
jgi:valyl-tRNA synthetase